MSTLLDCFTTLHESKMYKERVIKFFVGWYIIRHQVGKLRSKALPIRILAALRDLGCAAPGINFVED